MNQAQQNQEENSKIELSIINFSDYDIYKFEIGTTNYENGNKCLESAIAYHIKSKDSIILNFTAFNKGAYGINALFLVNSDTIYGSKRIDYPKNEPLKNGAYILKVDTIHRYGNFKIVKR